MQKLEMGLVITLLLELPPTDLATKPRFDAALKIDMPDKVSFLLVRRTAFRTRVATRCVRRIFGRSVAVNNQSFVPKR